MNRLTSIDAQFLAMEDGRTHAHVAQLTILDGTTGDGTPFTLETLRSLISERLHLMPPFRWKLKPVPFNLDYPVWVEDADFDLDDHLWQIAVPAPGTDESLSELVGRLVSRPLDRDRPLWEVYVISGLRDGRVALLTKVHHSLVDGMSGLELLGAIIDTTPEGRDLDDPSSAGPTAPLANPSDLELFARGVASLPYQQVRMARALPATLRHMDQITSMRGLPGSFLLSKGADAAYRLISRDQDGEILERPAGDAPRTSLTGRLSAHRRFAFGSLDFATVRAIKETQPDVTINDVVVAAVSGALRRRLQARGDSVATPLVGLVPFSVRDKKTDFGNHIAVLMVTLPTDEADPVRRLERAHDVMVSAKTRHRAMPAKLVQEANHTVPPALFARVARSLAATTANGWSNPPFNVTISNLPGSPTPLYCAGSRVIAQHPVNILLEGMSVALTLLSYGGRLDYGFTVDRDIVEDVCHLRADLEAELAVLAEAVGVSKSRKKVRR